MNPTSAQSILAWLLTYALHSTVLLVGASVLVRSRRLSPTVADVVWKAALVGGILTATTQVALDRRPAGSFALAAATVEAGPDASVPARDGAAPETPAGSRASNERIGEPASAVAGLAGATGDAGNAGAAPAGAMDFPWVFALATAWLVVAVALVLWYVGRRLILVGRLGDRRPVEAGELTTLLDTLCRDSGFRSYVHLTASGAISSPVALGNGEICLPAAALVELEPAQQRAMLAHELAHLVRRDPQWLALSCVVERAFFFQPLNRLARRGLQESAELCADEWAARHSGGVPLARALVKVAEWIQASPLGVPVAGFAEERSQLTRRVSRLLEAGALGTPRSRFVAVSAALGVLLFTAGFAPGVAGTAVALVGGDQPASETAERSPEAGIDDDADDVNANDDGAESAMAVSPATPPRAAKESSSPAPDGPVQGDRLIVDGAVVDTAIVRAVMLRLKDEVADVRRAAADALGRLKHQMAIPALVEALEDEDAEVRRAALSALSNYERGVPAAPIRRLLASEDEEMRYNAIEILKEMRDRQSIPTFIQMLSDQSEEVRHYALHALDDLEAAVSEDVLGRAMDDTSADVRETAAQIAGDRQVTAMVPKLIRMLDDRNASVREQSAHALTEMRTEASHAALRRALTHTDSNVRRIAVEYFGSDRDK